MTTDYPGRISVWDVLVTATAAAAFAAAVIGLVHWLTPQSAIEATLPAEPPATDTADGVAPGGIDCPTGPVPRSPASSLLIDCPGVFDGRVVSYQGEVVEAVVRRGGYAVAVLNDDEYGRTGPLPQTRTAQGGNAGLTVLMPPELEAEITVRGSYRARGDVVAVEGVFTAANTVLGGEPAIMAATAQVVVPGEALGHVVDGRTAWTAGLFAVMATGIAGLAWRGRRS